MPKTLLESAIIVNNEEIKSDHSILIKEGLIEAIDHKSKFESLDDAKRIDLSGLHLLPGVIDTQVHFRDFKQSEDKGSFRTESRAAVAGGTTSVFHMGNSDPPILEIDTLDKMYEIAERDSLVNHASYMLCNGDNLEEIAKLNPEKHCGLKIFIGKSTGGFTCPIEKVESILRITKGLNEDFPVAFHSEDVNRCAQNEELYHKAFGDDAPMWVNFGIRDHAACLDSTIQILEANEKVDANIHILHLTTKEEAELFRRRYLGSEKITAEACVHHLILDETAYDKKGALVKCFPALKSALDREYLAQAVKENVIRVVATDHAPHNSKDKAKNYWQAPGGLPLVQHSLALMLEFYHDDFLNLETIVDRMAHAPARRFKIKNRGFIKERFFADLVAVDLKKSFEITSDNIRYHCGFSPFEEETLRSSVVKTWVNGTLVYDNDEIIEAGSTMALEFDRR